MAAVLSDENEEFWSDHAFVYDTEIDRVIGRASRRAVYDYLRGLRDLGDVVAFGCGPGFYTRVVAQRARHVTAVDIAPEMLARARAHLAGVPNVGFAHENCERTTFPDAAFDTVFTANVVQILEHPGLALKEAYRILQPGGRLVLLFFTFKDLGLYDRFKMMIKFMSRFHGMPYRHMMTAEEIGEMAEGAGFRVEELKLIGGKVKAVYLMGRKPA